jgi:hypothetical protein
MQFLQLAFLVYKILIMAAIVLALILFINW